MVLFALLRARQSRFVLARREAVKSEARKSEMDCECMDKISGHYEPPTAYLKVLRSLARCILSATRQGSMLAMYENSYRCQHVMVLGKEAEDPTVVGFQGPIFQMPGTAD